MAKGFKHGAGGGGTSLNFDVKAYATEALLLAATPKANTIGVITGTPITGWIFNATQPETIAEGAVWFPTAASSPVAFNALRHNFIEVCPVSAKQYIGGAWVDVAAKSYQNGEWVEMLSDLVFFGNGKFNTNVFGEISGAYTINGDGSFRANTGATISSTTLVDISNFSTFQFEITNYNWSNPTITLINASGATVATFGRYTEVGVYTSDVSAINEPVKIKITLASNSGSGNSDMNNIKFLK